MKSLISHLPSSLIAGAGDSRLEKAKSRLLRIVGRHQAKGAGRRALAPPIGAAAEPETGIHPLYDPSVYFSALLDDDLPDEDE